MRSSSRSKGLRAVGAGLVLWTLCGVLTSTPALAQRPSELAEGIVAVVDDTAVLRTELEEYVLTLQVNERVRVPEDPRQRRQFYRQLLDQKINEVVVYVHAKKAGIEVPDAQVEAAVEDRITRLKRLYNSELEFQQALAAEGLTEAEFRLQVSEQMRTQLTSRTFLQQQVAETQPVPVSEQEIRDLFEAQKQTLGPKPATITLKQVIVPPRPSEDARLAAEETAEQALSRARSGEDFTKLAREYSEDPASRTEGGQLGWVQRGQLLPEFERALFAMRPGQISDIVETSVGLHIIKLERVRGNERLARHILIRPEITEQDVETARQTAREVAEAMKNGADIDSLIALYHKSGEQSSLTNYPIDQLPPSFRQAVEGSSEGAVIGPIELSVPGPIPTQFAVAKILERSEGGEWTLDDWRDRIRQQIEQNKRIEQVIDRLRESTYIDVRGEMVDALAALPPPSG